MMIVMREMMYVQYACMYIHVCMYTCMYCMCMYNCERMYAYVCACETQKPTHAKICLYVNARIHTKQNS